MAHRIYRLSASPEQAPEVRRVVDFDGRSTLADVHFWLRDVFELGDDDHLYAFFLSDRYWDAASEYVDPRSDGRRADKALLFRLGLRVGMRFAYVYDFRAERRLSLSVLGIADSAEPLAQPVLVESVGELPVYDDPFLESDEDWTDDEHPVDSTLAPLIPLAEAVFEQSDALIDLIGDAEDPEAETPEEAVVLIRHLADAALALAEALRGERKPLLRLANSFPDRELILRLLDLPLELFDAGEVERSLALARGLAFISPDEVNGDLARIYAQAGRCEEALEQVAKNLAQAAHRYSAETKAGDVYRALGQDDAAEAYYRRALAEATTPSEIAEARLNVTTLLLDTGRQVEAVAFIEEQRQRGNVGLVRDSAAFEPAPSELPLARVGRNDPCPCGSSKKYKKCHGA